MIAERRGKQPHDRRGIHPHIGKLTLLFLVLAQGSSCSGDAEDPAHLDRSVAASGTEDMVDVSEVLGPRVPEAERTRVMILGSWHLREIQGEFEPEMVDGLIRVLKEFAPDLVAVESRRPEDIAAMKALGGPYDRVLAQYAASISERGERVRARLGITRQDAVQRQEALLAANREVGGLSEDDRLDLVLHSVAAYDHYTALLQWSYLDPDQRASAERMPDGLAESLDQNLELADESVSIGLRLAHELGHPKLHPIDEQMSEAIQSLEESQALMAAWEETGIMDRVMATYEEILDEPLDRAVESGDLLPFYLYLNSPDYQVADLEGQWAPFLEEGVDPVHGRTRLARREVRDLRIAANIRQIAARHPGSKVLVVIGASHKSFLESYLAPMMDMEFVQLSELVKT